jgi:hypothetical protein
VAERAREDRGGEATTLNADEHHSNPCHQRRYRGRQPLRDIHDDIRTSAVLAGHAPATTCESERERIA